MAHLDPRYFASTHQPRCRGIDRSGCLGLPHRTPDVYVNADQLLDALDYRHARAFLEGDRWHEAAEHAHALEHTATACAAPRVRGRFRGVYMIGVGSDAGRRATTPVVLVCEAPDERAADAIHRLAWNQSVAPFLIVHTPMGVRLYSGFDYEPGAPDGSPQRGLLAACVAFDAVSRQLDAFRADRIDDGSIWRVWGEQVDPTRKVDARLLKNLTDLSDHLIADDRPTAADTALKRTTGHALIGRFVYLRYLRDRGILTDSRIRSWGLEPEEVFGRHIRLGSFHDLIERLQSWLNGSIFPLPRAGKGAPRASDVQLVAGVLLGDDAQSGQLHLNFQLYDFSHIPIELLSSIYERFMAGHEPGAGVYYTPIPLVNFVLGELDDLQPLRHGMRVFDPSCGSGAFLVQCYQLLILRRRQELERHLTPRELRDLLTEHIFGVDREGGACRVTEFSLALALLDQIPTEKLARLHNFKLPDLRDTNIFEQDFFAPAEPWRLATGFDWIVGNPPWAKARGDIEKHEPIRTWIAEHAKDAPVAGNQIAEAFAWKAAESLSPHGVVAFAMPATTLFGKQADFRAAFFAGMDVKAVANLANLRRVLFGRRAEHPCAVFFYTRRTGLPEPIHVYSPMVANQEAGRPAREGEQQPIWSITVNHGEIRVLQFDDIARGETLPWKICMWGSSRDLRLLRALERRFPSLEHFARGRFVLSEGLQLRDRVAEAAKPPGKREDLERLREAIGKLELALDPLADASHVHTFPASALTKVADSRGYVRPGRGKVPLSVCRPPHIIVSAARTFAVFSDEYLIVPPRQIGIAGGENDSDLLKALALYLSSRFVRYHQFFLSPQEGIRGGRSTLDVLRKVPIPFGEASVADLRPWVRLHGELAELSSLRWAQPDDASALCERLDALEAKVDDLTFRALGLRPHETCLIQDLVDVRMALIDGKVGKPATDPPTLIHIQSYAATLRDCLDAYLDRGEKFRHCVSAVLGRTAGAVEVAFDSAPAPHTPVVEDAHAATAVHLQTVREHIDRSRGQWLYHDRNMTLYFDERAYVFKPMQRLWWTRSQALADADRIIADLVAAGGHA